MYVGASLIKRFLLKQNSIPYHFRRAVHTRPGKYQSGNPPEGSPASWSYDSLLRDLLTYIVLLNTEYTQQPTPEMDSNFSFFEETEVFN